MLHKYMPGDTRERIKDLLSEAKMNQEELAEKLGHLAVGIDIDHPFANDGSPDVCDGFEMKTMTSQELAEICGKDKPIKVVATGGLASMIAGGVDCIDEVDKMLTLEGLKVIYEKNKKPCRHDQKDYEWNNEELG